MSVFCEELGHHLCHICQKSVPTDPDKLLANYQIRVDGQNREIDRLNTIIRNNKHLDSDE